MTDSDEVPEWLHNLFALESFSIEKRVAYMGTVEYWVHCTICRCRMNNIPAPMAHSMTVWALDLRETRAKHVRSAVCQRPPSMISESWP